MLGALHEIVGEAEAAAAALFAAGIMTRVRGMVLWCMAEADLFAPALAQAGLDPDRVIQVEAGDDGTVLACGELGLRHGTLGGVVVETVRLSLTASRRLQLAAEACGSLGIAVRRWGRPTVAEPDRPTAAVARWRVSALPSTPLPVPGIGRARWRVELVRSRGGAAFALEVEACDAAGRLALRAELADLSNSPLIAGRLSSRL